MRILLLAGLLSATAASAADLDVIVKLNPNANRSAIQAFAAPAKPLGGDWYQVKGSNLSDIQVAAIKASPAVQYVQPNYKIKLMHDFRATDPKLRAQVEKAVKNNPELIRPFADNPPIPDISTQKNGPDPLYSNQWGMKDIGVAGSMHSTGKLIVAVIDTGVDYTHEDLAANMWKNKGEMGADAQGKDKATN
ncbi:MAG: protease, partial [Bdellovibrionia bacterium]